MIKEVRKRISNSKEAKRVIENIISLTLLQVCGYVFPLITFPYLTRIVGADCFGLLAFASTVISYFQSVTDWGFQFTAVRDIAQNRNDKDEVSRIFSNVMNARVFMMMICLVILLFLILIVPDFRKSVIVLLLTFLLLPGHIIFPEWFFQGIEKMRYVTIMNFLFKMIFTVLVFVFIRERNDYILQPVLSALGYLVAGFASIYLIVRRWGYRWYWTSFKTIWLTIKNGFDIFINTIIPQIYNSFSQILLMAWSGATACGVYAAADKFNAIMTQLIQVVSRAFFPFLARRIDKHTLYAVTYISISCSGAIVLFLFSPLLVKLFLSGEFEGAILILRLLSISIIFTALQNVYGTNYLIVLHYDKVIRNINLVCSILGLLVSIPLVYFLGMIGAALTVLFTRALLGITVFIKAYQIKNLN